MKKELWEERMTKYQEENGLENTREAVEKILCEHFKIDLEEEKALIK